MAQYIDGTTLTNSTAVWSNPQLTICSPLGFYSDGTIVRELVAFGNSCTLLPPQTCPSCAIDCDELISVAATQGVYNLDLNLGSVTGAVVLKMFPGDIPDGMVVRYDSQSFNKLSSPNYGLLQSTVAGEATYIGTTSASCLTPQTYTNIDNFDYVNSTWVLNGTVNVPLQAGQIQVQATAPGESVIVIPKPNATPSTLTIQVIGLCANTGWNGAFTCPKGLTGVASNLVPAASSLDVCALNYNTVMYHVPVNALSTPGNVNLHDYLFTDVNGQTAVADGWYLLPSGSDVEVTDGIVTAETSACNTWIIEDCLDQSQHTVLRGNNVFVSGDTIQYETLIPTTGPDGINRCGTILSSGTAGQGVNAIIASPLVRACNDVVNCPQ